MAIKELDTIINGVNVHYLIAGEGQPKPIILLHGTLADAKFHWPNVMQVLALEYQVIAPDLPGFGRSDPLAKFNYQSLLSWLEAFYKKLDLEQAVLVGHSFGGLISRLFAANYPHYVPGLILINGGSLPPRTTPLSQALAATPILSNLLFSALAGQGIGSREALNWVLYRHQDTELLTDEMINRAKDSAPGRARVTQLQARYRAPAERTPRIPTLILWGEQDTFSPLRIGEAVKAAIPGAKLKTITETRNAPHIEEPDVIAFQIQTFLDNMGRKKPDLPGAGMLG